MIISNLIIPRDRDFRHIQAASWPMRRVVSNILYFTILDDSLFVHHTTALRHAAAAAHAQCSAALLLPNRSRMFEQQRRVSVDSVTCAPAAGTRRGDTGIRGLLGGRDVTPSSLPSSTKYLECVGN